MPFLEKLKNIFSSGGENKKKSKPVTYSKQDVDPNEIWSIVGELGDGAFGKVYKARQKLKPVEAALKQVEIKDEIELEEFSVEIEILSQCRHKNVVGLYEAYFHGNKLWMFIEFCGGGALDSIMVDLEKPLTEPQIRYVCRQMCEGLDFLHQSFVIHRDLKAGNVLLTSDGQVKLADFGVSAKNTSFRQMRDTFIGTPYWMAPEVILCETIKDSPYTFKADIWSLGITLIEFAEIQPPNYQLHPMRVLIKIQKSSPPTLRIPTKWSNNFRDFIAKCLVKDPDARPTMGELLEHSFINDVTSNESIVELLSEVKAEVILEEKDLDDVMDDVISVIINDILDHPTEAKLLEAAYLEVLCQNGIDSLVGFGSRSRSMRQASRRMTTDYSSTDSPDALFAADAGLDIDSSDASLTYTRSEAVVTDEPVSVRPVVSTTPSDETLTREPVPVIPETRRQLLDTAIIQEFQKQSETSATDLLVQNPPNVKEVSVNNSATKEAAPIQSTKDLIQPSTETVPNESLVEMAPVQATVEILPSRANKESVPVQSGTETLPNCLTMETISNHSTQNASSVELGMSDENQLTVQLSCGLGEVERNKAAVEDAQDETAFGNEQHFKGQESVALDKRLLHESLKLNSSDEMKPSSGVPVIGNGMNDSCTNFTTEAPDKRSSLTDVKNVSKKENSDKACRENQEQTAEKSDDVCRNKKSENKDKVIVEADSISLDTNAIIANKLNSVTDLTETLSANAPKASADEVESVHVNVGKSDSKVRTEHHLMGVVEAVDVKKDYQSVEEKVFDGSKLQQETVSSKTAIKNLPGSKTENVSENLGSKFTSDVEGTNMKGSHECISTNEEMLTRDAELSRVKKVETDAAAKQLLTPGAETLSLEVKHGADDGIVEISSGTDATGKSEAKEGIILRYKPNKLKVPPANVVPHGEKVNELAKSKDADIKMDDVGKQQTVIDEEEQKKQFRTLTKTRKFVVNGVVVTSQTSRVVLSGTANKKHQEHELWKADLRELKRLQMEENRLLQALDTKAKTTLDELARKQEADMQELFRYYEVELEQLAKQHQKVLNKLVSSQNSEYKVLQKKVKSEQEKDLKNLHESLKQDMKLWKQGVEMLPKHMRKEAMAKKKEEKEIKYGEKERKFLEEQHEKSEATMKRLTDQHQEKIVLLDKQFLQQKHYLRQVQQSRATELEERHLQEKYVASKIQLQEKFILRRQLMMQRNNKEIEQMKRINNESVQKLNQSQALELRKLPKKLKADAKTRQLMYKESLRISFIGATPEQEKEKIRQFEENEKSRKKEEILRIENKHKRQLEALNNRNDKQLKELEEMHAEKQNMLSDHQDQKLLELEKAFESEKEMWKSNLESRNQALADECSKEITEHDHFYSQDNGGILRVPSQRSLTGSVKSGSLVGSMKSGSYRGSWVM